jgi:hypothetical protein
VRSALAAAALLASTACAPKEDARPEGPLAAAAALVDRPRSPGETNGLEVVRWSVADRDAAIRRALERHADRSVPLSADAAALVDAGFRVAVVPDALLPSLLADLGGTTSAVTTWFGQTPQWRETARTELGEAIPIMVDGRPERLSGGWLRLMTRGWTVELEDGAAFELQLVPQWVQEATELSSLLNRDALRGRVLSGAAISLELPRNTSLVVVAAPARPEAEEDPEGPPSDTTALGLSGGLRGPPADLPATPGELLLTDGAARPPRRIVLLFRARLPDTLFPTIPDADP